MDENFAEMAAEYKEETDESEDEMPEERLEAGDTCPEEGCDRTLHRLTHKRDSQLGTERHKDAPEIEIVCRADGVLESR